MKKLPSLSKGEIEIIQSEIFTRSKNEDYYLVKCDFVVNNYEKYTILDFSRIFRCNPRTIQLLVHKLLPIEKRNAKIWTEQEMNDLKEDYLTMDMEQLTKKYSRSKMAIGLKARKLLLGERRYDLYSQEGNVVHHIDCNPSNNKNENLYNFESLKEHKLCHKQLNIILLQMVPFLLEQGLVEFKNGIYRPPSLPMICSHNNVRIASDSTQGKRVYEPR